MILVLCLGGVIYSIFYLKTQGINPAYLFLDQNLPKSFVAKSVSHFEWRTRNKIFVFDRDPKGHWAPEKDQKVIESLLEFISEIQLKDVQQTGTPSVAVILKIDNQKWEGHWDGLSFVWTDGPQKGRGEILGDKKNVVFFRGKFIFDDIAINFCETRIQEISMQLDGKNYDLLGDGRNWQLQNSTQKVDSVFVEKWLTQLCKAKIKAVIDPAYIPTKSTTSAITLRYVSGQALNLNQVEGDLFLYNDMGLVLEGFKKSLESLKKELP